MDLTKIIGGRHKEYLDEGSTRYSSFTTASSSFFLLPFCEWSFAFPRRSWLICVLSKLYHLLTFIYRMSSFLHSGASKSTCSMSGLSRISLLLDSIPVLTSLPLNSTALPVDVINDTHSQLVAFYFLNMWPSHLGLPVLLTATLLSKNVQRHPTFVNLFIVWIVVGL